MSYSELWYPVSPELVRTGRSNRPLEGDTSPPPTVPTGLAASNITANSVQLSWAASTDTTGVTDYEIYRNATFLGVVDGLTLSFTDASMSPSTTYTFTIRAGNGSGSYSGFSSNLQVTSLAAGDTIPPSSPQDLTSAAITSTSVVLTWTASTDNVGVTKYIVYRGGVQVASVNGATLSYTDNSLSPNSTYSYTVRAGDAVNNLSALTTATTITTAPAPDTTPPSAPTGLQATSITQTSVHISWSASTDGVGVTQYFLLRDNTPIATVTTLSYNDTTLLANTSYSYSVKAGDAANNTSAASSSLNVTTLPTSSPNSRDLLVLGVDKPNATTTGVIAGTTLVNYNASSVNTVTITTANQVFQNMRIYGDIKIQAAGVIFRNCELVGGNQLLSSGNTGVVDCNSAACSGALFEDCTITPRLPSYYRDGIVGHGYTARRCHIYNTNDGLGIFNKPGGSVNANVSAEGNYIHDLVYWRNDPAHSDGTHNDCIQIQGGSNIHIIGNRLVATSIAAQWPSVDTRYGAPYSVGNPSPQPGADKTDASGNPDLFPHSNGAGIIVQINVAPLVNCVVEKNWIDNGLSSANLKPGSYTFQQNKFGRNQYPFTATSKYVIRIDSRANTTVTGLATNTWEDNGTLLTEGQSSGIRYNA